MDSFTFSGAAMEERPLVFAVSENAGKTPEMGTNKPSSSNTDEDGRKTIPEIHDKPRLVQNCEDAEKQSGYDKNDNATADRVGPVEQSVPDCESDYADSCGLASDFKDVHTGYEMNFDADRDYSYNWMDDMWTAAYGARSATRADESEYEAEMERVQAQYEMEFELNQCNPYSLMNVCPKNDTQNKDASGLEHNDVDGNGAGDVTDQDYSEAHCTEDSYSEVNSVEDDQSEEAGTDEASIRIDDDQGQWAGDDFETHSGDSYSDERQSETTGEDDFESHSSDSSANSDGNSSDDDEESEESDTDEASSDMDDDELADYERDEYERAKRKEMDIIRWIENVNKVMFPHLINNRENQAAVKECQVPLALAESLASISSGLDDVQSSAVSEDEIDHDARSNDLSKDGSQSSAGGSEKTRSDNKEARQQTRIETADVQSAVTEDQEVHSIGRNAEIGDYERESEETSHETTDAQNAVLHGGRTTWTNGQKTLDKRGHERAVCYYLEPVPMKYGQEKTQVTGVAPRVSAADNGELLRELKTVKIENNATGLRGRLGGGLERFSRAARRFFQRCLPRCCRGNNE